MSKFCVTGLQWGDEGKGKIVDLLSERADIVVRFQGGNNAGHTVVVGDKVYKTSLIPSGIISGRVVFVGSGVVIDIASLIKEIETLQAQGLVVDSSNLLISEQATVVLPIYRQIDAAQEEDSSSETIGTTKRGIGIAYQDRAARRALRICDLFEGEDFVLDKITKISSFYSRIAPNGLETARDQMMELMQLAEKIKPFMVNELQFMMQNSHKKMMFEGAQGFWLDVFHGTYPFVTSSSTVSGQIFSGCGLGLNAIEEDIKNGKFFNIGTLKAYTTRVGSGPFVCENGYGLDEMLRTKGGEFGTITGRDRRCGPLDLVLARHAAIISGVNCLAITKIDVLDDLKEIPVCVAYELDGKRIDFVPSKLSEVNRLKPIYEVQKGWMSNTVGVKKFNDLPQAAKNYVAFIEKYTALKAVIISTGQKRDDTIFTSDI